MSKWLKRLLFTVWGLLLIPPLAPIVQRTLEEIARAEHDGIVAAALRAEPVVTAFNKLAALNQQSSFITALLLVTGMVIGASLEWLTHWSDARKAYELKSIGAKFRSLSDSIRIRTVAPGWPDSVRDLQPAILAALSSAQKFGLWIPNDQFWQLPDASFLCEYFRSVGKLLEDGEFEQATSEALSWQPFLGHATPPPRATERRQV